MWQFNVDYDDFDGLSDFVEVEELQTPKPKDKNDEFKCGRKVILETYGIQTRSSVGFFPT